MPLYLMFFKAGRIDIEKAAHGRELRTKEWSTPYEHNLTSKGLIKGVSTETGACFMPLNNMTNAEIATILHRILAS